MQRTANELETVVESALYSFQEGMHQLSRRPVVEEVGRVTSISVGTATVSGLPGACFEELLRFSNGLSGLVFNLDPGQLGVVVLGNSSLLEAGMEVERSGRVMDVPVGEGLLGRVIDGTGSPLDGKGALSFRERWPVERPAAAILSRAPVTAPLQTGIKVIDALVPIGRGQRELILGDRQSGKTAIAVDTILNQRNQNVICVYCAIGQRDDSVAKVVSILQQSGAMSYTTAVVAEGEASPALKFIVPYAATTIAEYFMEQGRDVLIVYDDLSQHARAYRELSLLLRRPPGREAFPGDIFYIHARLLERATHLRAELKGGSLTALPIVETEAQNISAYIPTNLISITDGQIYVSPTIFQKGNQPAVDVGKSVSRVGGKAQLPAFRSVAGDLKLRYSQFEELEVFSRFGTRLDENTRKALTRGLRIRECLRQSQCDSFSVPEQIIVLLALSAGLLDGIALADIRRAEKTLRDASVLMPGGLRQRLLSGGPFKEEDRSALLLLAENALAPLQKENDARHTEHPGQKSS